MPNIIEGIQINSYSATPKYVQLANAIKETIESRHLQVGDLLPSINELMTHLDVSRQTIYDGYMYLRHQQIIKSVPGKGYFVAKSDIRRTPRIAFFLNKLSEHKKIVYDSFVTELGNTASVDLFVYNSDLGLFRTLIQNLEIKYEHYIVFPYFAEGRERAPEMLNLLPADKLLLLGNLLPGLNGSYSAVFENYEVDIFESMKELGSQLSKYETLKLVFPDRSDYPKGIIKGFYRFCRDNSFVHQLVEDVVKEKIRAGDCYITMTEHDLVSLLETINVAQLILGRDVGVISYNETPLKKFIMSGITTISADFSLMGRWAAHMIDSDTRMHRRIPFHVILRGSL